MSPSQLTRASGWAAALAGAFFIIAEVLTPITLFTNPDTLAGWRSPTVSSFSPC